MLSGLFRFLNERFARFIQFFSDFVDPFLDNIIANGGDLLMQAAYKAVVSVAADPTIITDEAKRDAAFQQILDELKTGGINVARSAANSAIEIALQRYKADKALEDNIRKMTNPATQTTGPENDNTTDPVTQNNAAGS